MTAVVLVLLTLCVCFGIRCKETAAGRRLLRRTGAGRKRCAWRTGTGAIIPIMLFTKWKAAWCAQITRRVENTINRMDGYWAGADVAGARANVRKEKPDLGRAEKLSGRPQLYGAVCGMRRTRVTPASMCCKRFSVCFV